MINSSFEVSTPPESNPTLVARRPSPAATLPAALSWNLFVDATSHRTGEGGNNTRQGPASFQRGRIHEQQSSAPRSSALILICVGIRDSSPRRVVALERSSSRCSVELDRARLCRLCGQLFLQLPSLLSCGGFWIHPVVTALERLRSVRSVLGSSSFDNGDQIQSARLP